VTAKQTYAVVAACAGVAYVGALWNRWAFDDLLYVAGSDLVHSASGWWRAFLSPYLPPELGGYLYRPLTVATYALDWHLDGPAWFHAVNVLWHVAAAVLVAILANRWAGTKAALLSGVVFAVHPVHVEAVANVVGRAELMATVFTLLAVYAALERRSIAWCTSCWLLGLLSKESAAVLPALVAAAWALGIGRPTGRQMLAFAGAWIVAAGLYAALRESVLHPYG
jgi:protein O-mannosyl-transferase